MLRLLFQGDSITDGNRYKDPATRWDLNHQIGHSYVFSIAAALGSRAPGKYHIINRGVSGDCIDKLSARWETDTLAEAPDILTVLIGINGNADHDGVYPHGADAHLGHFETRYRALLTAARAQNPKLKLILIEPFFLPVGKHRAHYRAFMQVFTRQQDIVRRLAAEFDAIFIPVQKPLEALVATSAPMLTANGWQGDPNAYWLWDGIHPTEAMHGYLASAWLDAAAPIL